MPRARLNSGSPSPLSMMQGIDQNVDGAFFIGYHARQGSQGAVLDHTWSNTCVANVWLNDMLAGEYTLNAALAGHFNVPILMVSGDQIGLRCRLTGTNRRAGNCNCEKCNRTFFRRLPASRSFSKVD